MCPFSPYLWRRQRKPISSKRYVTQQPKAISNSSLYIDGSPYNPPPSCTPTFSGVSHVASTVRLSRDCRTFRQRYRADIFCYRTFLFPSGFCPLFLRALCRSLPSYLLLCLCSSSTLPPNLPAWVFFAFYLRFPCDFFMVIPQQRRLPLSVLGITQFSLSIRKKLPLLCISITIIITRVSSAPMPFIFSPTSPSLPSLPR